MGAVRVVLLVIAGLLVAGGVAMAILCVILLIGLLIERWRYKPLADRSPGPDWRATGERFVDPETGKLVTVYYHPASGERRYVAL
jgi:hypothetical protein